MAEDINEIKINPTDHYINECSNILKLERVKINANKKVYYYPDSLSHLFWLKLKRLYGLRHYIKELFIGWRWLKKTYKLKGQSSLKKAMIIANGPSQGFLTVNDYLDFQNKGGEIFVVNYWHKNEKLNKVIPDYCVISDPEALNKNTQYSHLVDNNTKMEEYLHKHKSIKIFCPVSRYKEICLIFGEKRVFCFINSNLKGFYDFASPLIPRAYTEGVVHDSLSIASWMGYSKIFLIGLDNTYPRKLYSDANNSILNCTYYASEDTGFLEDTTLRYGTMADRVLSISFLFYSANLLAKNGNIINLDPYSLTDAFEKVKITNNNYSNIW